LNLPQANDVWELLEKYFAQLLAGAGAVVTLFMAPYAAKFIERRFSKKPTFALRSPVLRSNLQLIVEPANSSTRKRRPLGVTIRGLNLINAGKLERNGADFKWIVDLSKFEDFLSILKEGEDYSFQFFFDVDRLSDPVLIRYVGAPANTKPTASTLDRPVYVDSANELVLALRSNSKIITRFSESILTRAILKPNQNTRWENVYDGKELNAYNLSNVDISGNSSLLIEPRYAWVLNFHHCHSIAIRGLRLGHTEEGYCVGGVLRFESCSNIVLENCDLFGCGTYGLEFVDCEQVDIFNSIIRQCTYGIANFNNISNVKIRNCEFKENRCFNAISLTGGIDLAISKSTFSQNSVYYEFFKFDKAEAPSFRLDGCTFKDNVYPRFTNEPRLVALDGNEFVREQVGRRGWEL
jgi:hypothetical protein